MKMRNLSKIAGGIEVPRSMRKKLRRVSKSPTARAVAALLPIVTVGLVAASRLMRRRPAL